MVQRSTIVIATLGVLTAIAGAWRPADAQGSEELAGAWIVTSWESSDGEVNSEPQRGLFVFTASGNYSMMYVFGSEPRPEYTGENLTDDEKLAAYDSFVANSGRYSVDGDQIIYEAYMAKDPNYMAAFEENATTVSFTLEGETLTLTWMDGFAEGETATFRRPRRESS